MALMNMQIVPLFLAVLALGPCAAAGARVEVRRQLQVVIVHVPAG